MAEKESKIGKFVASIVQLFDRNIEVFGDDNIYMSDSDNLYPNRVELVERNSVTAISCANKLKSFIQGRGFENNQYNEMIVNHPKNMKGYQFLDKLANSLKTHRGAFIHVNYDAENKVNYLDVLNFRKCRISKEDANEYPGLIYYADWDKIKKGNRSGVKATDVTWFYPFGKENVTAQRLRDAKEGKYNAEDPVALLENYRGQVYFLNLDDTEVYPFAWVHSVYNDADNEYRISLYRNTNLRNGFLNKTMIIPNGLDKESRDEFDTAVKGWLGAENSSSVFVIKPDQYIEDLNNVVKTIELKGTYDSQRFKDDEESIANNIRKAYLAIPKILIDPENTIFSSSGESLIQAVKYYNKETLPIREAIAYMMDLFFDSKDFTIKELEEEQQVTQ